MHIYMYGFKNPCFYSSFLFLINIYAAYKQNNTLFFNLFSLLLFTSILTHYNYNKIIMLIDQFIVFLVISTGLLYLRKKYLENNCNILYGVISLSNLFAVSIIFITKKSKKPVKLFGIYAYFLHCLIHILGSFGLYILMYI